jgi:hypothetical protein
MTLTRPLAGRAGGYQPTGPIRPAGSAGHRAGFWLVGFVFLMTMAFSAVPAPLYVLYAARDTAVSGFAAVLAAAVALVSRPLLRRAAHR